MHLMWQAAVTKDGQQSIITGKFDEERDFDKFTDEIRARAFEYASEYGEVDENSLRVRLASI